jgi:hypothetical protein
MKNKPNPLHKKHTLFTGSFQAFSGTVVSPDDPRVAGRIRKGRPADSQGLTTPKKRGGKKPKK